MQEIEDLVQEIKKDYQKSLSGNKSASTRTRQGLQTLKKLSQALRVELLTAKKELV